MDQPFTDIFSTTAACGYVRTVLLGVNKIPNRPLADAEITLSQFQSQATDRKSAFPARQQQSLMMLTGDLLGDARYLASYKATRLVKPFHQVDSGQFGGRNIHSTQPNFGQAV